MNRQNKSSLLFIVLIFFSLAVTLSGFTQTRLWSSNSAELLPAGRFETGVFQPLRYGWSNSIEFSAHPLLFLLMPNFSVKWARGHSGAFIFATRHSVNYPTWLLKVFSREGTGGIISPEFDIPQMVAFGNEVLVSRPFFAQHQVTAKLGFKFALKSGDLDERTTIDLPLIYQRLNVFYHGYQFLSGVDFNGPLFWRWHYLADADCFFTPAAEFKTGVEHKLMLLWHKSRRFQLSFGYKLVYGEYPFGTQWHWLLPLFDCQWAWER